MKSLTTSISLFKTVSVGVLLSLCAAPALQAQDFSKVGFVDNERIIREATPSKVAQAKIQQEFAARSKDIEELGARVKALSEKFDRDAPTLSEADRVRRQRELIDLDKDYQRKQREGREDLTQRINEERTLFLERATKVIRQIAEAEKFDIIFQEGVYVSSRIDITDKVLKILNQ